MKRSLMVAAFLFIFFLFMVEAGIVAALPSSPENPPPATSPANSKPTVKETKPSPTPSKAQPKEGATHPRVKFPKINAMPLHEGESYSYRVTWQGELAGYSKFFVERKLSLAGESFYKIESLSRLKIGMGEIENLAFSSQFTVRAKDLLPSFFHCTQKQSGAEFTVDCLISNNLIAQQNHSPQGGQSSYKAFPEGAIPVIYLNNLWGRYDTLIEHYWVLLKMQFSGKIPAYDPILQYMGEIEIANEGKGLETVEINGKKTKARHFRLVGFTGETLFDIWTDEQRNILKMEEPGGGLTFEIANGDLSKELESVKGVDMWKDRVSASNIYFPNPKEINSLEAEVIAKGKGISTDFRGGTGLEQSFKGESSEGYVQGIFTVKTTSAEVKNPITFPIKITLSPELQDYTKTEMGIEADDDVIRNKALEIAWKSKDVWEAAKRINSWIAENISMGISLPSAKMTLANDQGNAESKAMLAIALCRNLGIPARKAGGIVFSAGNFIPHSWFEIYTGPDSGWVALDPSTGEAGNLGATHIKLFQSGDLWRLSVNVLNFSPRPPERLTYINRELTWPVGEERTYSLKKEGKKIGEETALMEEVAVMGDEETYKMKLQSDLEMEGRKINANATYWMNPQGLPIKYQKTLKSGDREEKQEFYIRKKMMVQDVKGFRGDFHREIPYSKGAYFADPHFLCQYAMIAGQFHDVSIGRTYNFYTFIPETLAVENVVANVKKFESVESGERIFDCFRIETNKGIIFWIEKGSGQVVKVSFMPQQVELELEKTKLKI